MTHISEALIWGNLESQSSMHVDASLISGSLTYWSGLGFRVWGLVKTPHISEALIWGNLESQSSMYVDTSLIWAPILQHTATHCNKQCVLQCVLQIYKEASLIWVPILQHTATHCNTLQQAVCAAVCVADIWESLSDMRKPNILIAGNPPSWGVSFSGCFYFKRREGEGPRPLEK